MIKKGELEEMDIPGDDGVLDKRLLSHSCFRHFYVVPKMWLKISGGEIMLKWVIICVLVLLAPLAIRADAAKSPNSDGEIDNRNGTTNEDLVYRDFEITPDGYVMGYIVNVSDHAIKSVKLDMWTSNKADTRILWRKALSIGDLPPKGKYQVKEPYSPLPDDPSQVFFNFRVQKKAK